MRERTSLVFAAIAIPLLASLYMRRFVLASKRLGLARSLGSRIANYAEDCGQACEPQEGDPDVGTASRTGPEATSDLHSALLKHDFSRFIMFEKCGM